MKRFIPARKAALEWFHDRGEVSAEVLYASPIANKPTMKMRKLMRADGQMTWRIDDLGRAWLSLTDKGRRDLHEAGQ